MSIIRIEVLTFSLLWTLSRLYVKRRLAFDKQITTYGNPTINIVYFWQFISGYIEYYNPCLMLPVHRQITRHQNPPNPNPSQSNTLFLLSINAENKWQKFNFCLYFIVRVNGDTKNVARPYTVYLPYILSVLNVVCIVFVQVRYMG